MEAQKKLSRPEIAMGGLLAKLGDYYGMSAFERRGETAMLLMTGSDLHLLLALTQGVIKLRSFYEMGAPAGMERTAQQLVDIMGHPDAIKLQRNLYKAFDDFFSAYPPEFVEQEDIVPDAPFISAQGCLHNAAPAL